MQQFIHWAPHPWASKTLLRSRFLEGILWDRGRVVHITPGLWIPAWTALDAEVQANKVSLSCEQSFLAALLCSASPVHSELLGKGACCSCTQQPVITWPWRQRICPFLPSATSFQCKSCCAALALAAAWMSHSKLYLFIALLNISMCLSVRVLNMDAWTTCDKGEGWRLSDVAATKLQGRTLQQHFHCTKIWQLWCGQL